MGFAKHFCPKNLASRRICVIVYPKRLLAQKPSAMEAFGMTNIMLYTLREAMENFIFPDQMKTKMIIFCVP